MKTNDLNWAAFQSFLIFTQYLKACFARWKQTERQRQYKSNVNVFSRSRNLVLLLWMLPVSPPGRTKTRMFSVFEKKQYESPSLWGEPSGTNPNTASERVQAWIDGLERYFKHMLPPPPSFSGLWSYWPEMSSFLSFLPAFAVKME